LKTIDLPVPGFPTKSTQSLSLPERAAEGEEALAEDCAVNMITY
jgi:hypothetical protein